MKFTWEEADVVSGRLVRSKTTAANNKSILGYAPGGPYYVVSLADGLMVTELPSKAAVAGWLNKAGHEPADDDRESMAAIDWLRGRRP